MKNRLEYIDSIRGIAALIVFFFHSLEIVDIKLDFIDLGRVGVVMFFIISGLVIPWSIQNNIHSPIKNFIIKRFFRLYPAYWASIILAVIVVFFFHNSELITAQIQITSIWQVILNFSMVQKTFGTVNILAPYWTLFIEVVFYVICACLFYTKQLHNSKNQLLLIVIFSVIALIGGSIRFYYNVKLPIILPVALSIMFYGAFLRNYLLDRRDELFTQVMLLSIFYFILLFITFKFYYQDGWIKWYTTYLFAFVFCILLLTKFKINNRVFVYFGKISYSFYLLHTISIVIVFHFLGNEAFTEIRFLAATTLSFCLTVALSDLSYRLIEARAVSIGGKFSKYKVRSKGCSKCAT